MSQPTSLQLLDAAIWKELGAEEISETEAFYQALSTSYLADSLLVRNIRSSRLLNFSVGCGPMLPNQNDSCETSPAINVNF
jgi:hypothetical protein